MTPFCFAKSLSALQFISLVSVFSVMVLAFVISMRSMERLLHPEALPAGQSTDLVQMPINLWPADLGGVFAGVCVSVCVCLFSTQVCTIFLLLPTQCCVCIVQCTFVVVVVSDCRHTPDGGGLFVPF